jgi:erythromycin esterase-like protein
LSLWQKRSFVYYPQHFFKDILQVLFEGYPLDMNVQIINEFANHPRLKFPLIFKPFKLFVQREVLMERSGLNEARRHFSSPREKGEVIEITRTSAEPFSSTESASFDGLLSRIGDAKVVLLGESTHGTSEFYQMRTRISQELITKKGFNSIAIEADWPDAEQLNRFIRHLPHGLNEKKVFKRFPAWMWKNEEFHSFVTWLRKYNKDVNASGANPVNLFGLDLYNLHHSIEAVLSYLEKKDPKLAQLAKRQYNCLLSWGEDVTNYGWAVESGIGKPCEDEVVAVLLELLELYSKEKSPDSEEFVPVFQNAVSVADAEEYYRAVFHGAAASWNIRDRHMFETLETILTLQGEGTKVIVWAHNSHVGNAAATQMREFGELNLGQLCKERYKEGAYSIGLGTHRGTVAAASYWGGEMKVKEVKASHPESIERLLHDTRIPSFFLPLRGEVKEALMMRLLWRAIGVIYLPETELSSHYLQTLFSDQFDEYIWFDHTHAITPTSLKSLPLQADLYPFGL